MKRLKKNEILVLRSCGENGMSRNNFTWPLEVGSVVEAPYWDGKDSCGGGLHGLPWGAGGNYSDPDDPVWLVLRVDTSADNYRHGTGNMMDKCKFKTCVIEGAFDNPKDATDMVLRYAPAGTVCNYAYVDVDKKGIAVVGHHGSAKAGEWGTATAGRYGTATAGRYGTATAGDRGTATAGDVGSIIIKWLDEDLRSRFSTGYIGENGLLPNVLYKLDAKGNFVEVGLRSK